jgi:predicted kinase
MVTPPLRCHLLIGPPASGKTTLAAVLAELVGGRVVSTDAIRAELFGDASIQGPWSEVETTFHAWIREAVAEGVPVIIDATHAQRPWRLAITQGLTLPAPVQWIGWWLTTPLKQCLAWDQARVRQVGAEVIKRIHGYLPEAEYIPDPSFLKKLDREPSQRDGKLAKQAKVFLDKKCGSFREEGFAYIAALNPALIPDLAVYCSEVLNKTIDRSIQAGNNRRQNMVLLHRYSMLLDQERLLFLIRLLLQFPGVEFYDHAMDHPRVLRGEINQLRQSFCYQPDTPLPDPKEATFARRAAFVLARRHGPCYGDVAAVEGDLEWLWEQGFASAFTVEQAIEPGPASELAFSAMDGGAGFPQAADRRIFQRQLGLLRYLIQNPFDAPDETTALDPELRLEGRKVTSSTTASIQAPAQRGNELLPKPRAQRQSASIRLHLLERLRQIEGVDYRSRRKAYGSARSGAALEVKATSAVDDGTQNQQLSTLDKDIELLITGYGFRNLLSSDSSPNKQVPNHVVS